MKTIILIFKIILSLFLSLFAVALFAAYSYFQGVLSLLIIVFLFYRPVFILNKIKLPALVKYGREIIPVLLIIIFLITILNNTKTSIYRSVDGKNKLYKIYDEKMQDWPEGYTDMYINTKYGKVHIISCGREDKPPVILLHAASMGAHSWAENIPALAENFSIYAIDNIGEGNKSELSNAGNYPDNGKKIGDLYAEISDSLGIDKSHLICASNGGFIGMNYAYYHPDRVKTMILLGPMGLMPLSDSCILIMTISSMYPFPFIKNKTIPWALGNSNYVLHKYGDWFDCVISTTIPSLAKPVPLTIKQKNAIKIPVLLFLGSNDPIVGDLNFASEAAKDFPNIRRIILESGHLIGVEQRDFVNREIKQFLTED